MPSVCQEMWTIKESLREGALATDAASEQTTAKH